LLQAGLGTSNANIAYILGIDATQNSWIISGNANSALAFSYINSANANISILFGIETTQNTWITNTDGKMQSAYNQANATAGGLITANANIVSTDGKMQSAYNQANVTAGGLITANANSFYIQSGLNSANANIALLQAGLITANANIVSTDGKMQSAYNQANVTAGGLITANANTVYIQSGLNSANANISYLFGVNLTQNTWITNTDGLTQSAYAQANAISSYANTTLSYLSGALITTNANTVYIQSGLNSANANIVSLQALANTDYTTVTSPTGTFGSATLVPVVTVAANGRITNISTTTITGGGAGANTNSFSTIVVSGQPRVIANSTSSPLTFVAGTGMTITTVGTSNTITFVSTGGFSGGTIPNPLNITSTLVSTNTTTGALVVTGGVGIGGALNATSKSFNIPHPTKPGKDLRYGSLEGPEFGVYVRGKLVNNNTIELPEYWTKLVHKDSITVQLTPIGKFQKLSVKEIKDNRITIGNDALLSNDINCFYIVFAERADIDKLEVES